MLEEFLAFMVVLLLFLFLLSLIFGMRKSKRYRKEVMDMYVASKTRQLAERDSLDLEKETEYFKKWLRKEKANEKDYELDDEIEDDLKEKISEPSKSETSKKK